MSAANLHADAELAVLRPLSRQFPTIDRAVAELARLAGELTLPKGTVHILSDVHGDDRKMRHVINNASGTLRPLLEQLFTGRLSADDLQQFIELIFYPHEKLARLQPRFPDASATAAFAERNLIQLFEVVHTLGRRFPIQRMLTRFPPAYRSLLLELLHERGEGRTDFFRALAGVLVEQERAWHVLRLTARLVRDLAIDELIIAGDFWDRGPRGDRVLDYLRRQPNVAITWGNHDTAWLGACLGHDVLVAHVLRISCRYGNLSQLDEGYGVSLQPLEHLARTVYGDDPAACFTVKGHDARDLLLLARMHKAASIMQFKLEGRLIERNPDFEMDNRRLLHRIDHAAGTVDIDGKRYPLRDTHFPTLDPKAPYDLSAAERLCLDHTKQAFLSSEKLWDHVRFLAGHGSLVLCRDDHLIFHGCVPVDANGAYLSLLVDGQLQSGKALFEALDRVIVRTLDHASDQQSVRDLDLLWYLWCGARSPLFGKDRIATFENDLVADPGTHVETKNPYFQLIHEVLFCERILAEFGVDPQRGLIVNGHVPVKIEQGENPLKRSGKAITIDGAFSEAYGDHGYTLVLEPGRTVLALHHHFESVEAAVRDGVDIIPEITVVKQWQPPRRVGDTERGAEIRAEIDLLTRLIRAYRANHLRQTPERE